MKQYTKKHTSAKALNNHVSKIKGKGGNCEVKGMIITYSFPSVKKTKKDKTTGSYATKKYGTRYHVIFKHKHGEEQLMSKGYATEAVANKAMKKIKDQAGV